MMALRTTASAGNGWSARIELDRGGPIQHGNASMGRDVRCIAISRPSMSENRGALVGRILGGSVRAKLLLLSLFLVVVPASVFAWIAIGSGRRALEHAVGRQLAEVAQDTAERVEVEVDRAASEVRGWSAEAEVRALATGEASGGLSRVLAARRASEPALLAVSVANFRGRVVAASDAARVGTLVSGREWWPTLARGESVIAVRGDRDPGGSLELVAPILDPERGTRVVGALVAEYPWEQMNAPLQHLQHDLAALGLEVTLLVLDGRGRVVAGGWWEEPSNLVGQNLRGLGWHLPSRAWSARRLRCRRSTSSSARSHPRGAASW